MAELDELIFEKEWRKCWPDWETSTTDQLVRAFDYWCSTYWHIRHPEKGRILFEMREAQYETIQDWIGERYCIALKARQIGFSTLAGALSFWLTFGYEDRAIIMISKTERDAIKLLHKSKYGFRFLPDWMVMHPNAPVVNTNQTKMEMTNESYIESLPSASDPARGESVFLIIVDEMGQLPNSEEAWAAIEPVADVGGRVIMLGTANGEGNLFHKLWVGCKGWGNGTNRFKGLFHSWRAGGRNDAWYEAKKADLPEWQMAQEYPDNPDEAFLKSGRPVFNLERLREIETFPPEAAGYLQRLTRGLPVQFVDDGGALSIWKFPQLKHRYTMGVDVAEGLEHGDFSSVHVVDANTREVVAHYHGHIDPDLFGSDVVALLGEYYNNALAVVESNNHGLTTLTALQRVKYFPIYRRRRLGNRKKAATEALGWATTAVSKPLAIDELAKELRDGGIVLYDESTIAELRTFVREGDGKMHGSPHDDRVMSLAIAVQGLKFVSLSEYRERPKPPRNSLQWMIDQGLFDDDDKQTGSFIGSSAVLG